MTNDEARRNDGILTTQKNCTDGLVIWAFGFHSSFDIRLPRRSQAKAGASSFFPLVDYELVSVGIAELRHPANRCLSFRNVERDAAI